jgi:SAM-dependent methyltransferase
MTFLPIFLTSCKGSLVGTPGFVCKICGSDNACVVMAQVRDSREHGVYACSSCSHVQLFPLTDRMENREYYDKNTQASWVRPSIDISKAEMQLHADTMRRADFLSRLLSKEDRVFEVGTGYGFLLQEVEKRGWHIDGAEISEFRRQIVKQRAGRSLYDFDLSSAEEIRAELVGHFNAVVAFQVFEHVLDPKLFLSHTLKLLAPQGKIVLEVPNRDDFMITLSAEYETYYYQKAHVSYFNAPDIMDLLGKAGFENPCVQYVQRYSIENAMNWLLVGKPQIENPRFVSRSELLWLDEYYKVHLCRTGTSDTVVVTASAPGTASRS